MSEELSRDATNHVDVICEAKIKPKATLLRIFSIVLVVIFGIFLLISRIPYTIEDSGVQCDERSLFGVYYDYYGYDIQVLNCYGECLDYRYGGSSNKDDAILKHMADGLDVAANRIYGFETIHLVTIIIICGLALSVIWNILLFVILSKIKYNKLLSKEEEIYCRFGAFSKKDCFLPFDKIQSLSVRSNLKDSLIGGKTVVIYGTSISIKVPCVQNADEFVNATLTEIKKRKDAKEATLDETKNSNTFDDIQKLKNLLEQGLISQEEYDAKRQELIRRI